MNITQSSFVQLNPSKRKRAESFFYLCMDERKDITISKKDFPLLDFAVTEDFKTFTPLEANVTYSDGKYCAYIPTYSVNTFPIALAKDWQLIDSIFYGKKSIQNSLYFLTRAMFLLFALSVFFTISHFLDTKLSFTLPKTILICLSIYSILRGVFFLLFSIGKLDKLLEKNQSGNFFSSYPHLLFNLIKNKI